MAKTYLDHSALSLLSDQERVFADDGSFASVDDWSDAWQSERYGKLRTARSFCETAPVLGLIWDKR